MEFEVARELDKPLYILLFADNFAYDAHGPEPEDRRALQQQYRAAIISTECYWEVNDSAELADRVWELTLGKRPSPTRRRSYSSLSRVQEEAPAPGLFATPTAESQACAPNSTAFNENVQFTAYRPKVIAPAKWTKMLVFAHLDDRPDWLDDDELGPIEEMELEAERMLGSKIEDYRPTTSDSSVAIPEDGEITIVPEIQGIEFNPKRRSFLWKDGVTVHHETFDMRASAALDGQTVRGVLTIFLGHLILAEITLAIRADRNQGAAKDSSSVGRQRNSAQPFRRVFTSYSRRDLPIVEATERYGRTLGDEYIRDLIYLRSGELWNDQLRELVRWADVFQLFWSVNSARSEFVESEWRYALSLNRPAFVRPTYWQEPMPEPPEPLRGIHFHRLAAEAQTTVPPPRQFEDSSGPDCAPPFTAELEEIKTKAQPMFMPSPRPRGDSGTRFMPSPAPSADQNASNARPTGLSPRAARLIVFWILIATGLVFAVAFIMRK